MTVHDTHTNDFRPASIFKQCWLLSPAFWRSLFGMNRLIAFCNKATKAKAEAKKKLNSFE